MLETRLRVLLMCPSHPRLARQWTDSCCFSMSTVAVHWFRKGLRLHDNPGLVRALAASSGRTVPLFVIDPWFLAASGRVGVRRYQFLLEALREYVS